MTGKVLVITGIVVTHLLGVQLFGLNSMYLWVTRAYDPNEYHYENEDLDGLKSKRCCKIRNGKAINVLVMYHVILQIADFVVFISESNRESEYAIDWPTHWMLPGMHFMFFICFMPVAAMLNRSTFSHIGPIHASNIFEFLHLAIFWSSIFYMSICAEVGCKNLAPDLRDLASGYAAIPMGWSYLVMLIGAWCNRENYDCSDIIISTQDFIRYINEELQKTPRIVMMISCGYNISNRYSSKYNIVNVLYRYLFRWISWIQW